MVVMSLVAITITMLVVAVDVWSNLTLGLSIRLRVVEYTVVYGYRDPWGMLLLQFFKPESRLR